MSTSIPSLITSSSVKKEQRISFLHYMLMAREFDLAMQRLNRQGRAFGGVYSQTGNEATSVGSASDVKARIDEFNSLAGHQKVHIGMTSRDL
ncbi:MAG: hypothetical protein ACKN9Y_08855, partial [Bacteroidota bacterium]